MAAVIVMAAVEAAMVEVAIAATAVAAATEVVTVPTEEEVVAAMAATEATEVVAVVVAVRAVHDLAEAEAASSAARTDTLLANVRMAVASEDQVVVEAEVRQEDTAHRVEMTIVTVAVVEDEGTMTDTQVVATDTKLFEVLPFVN
jgi:hypothetical protein